MPSGKAGCLAPAGGQDLLVLYREDSEGKSACEVAWPLLRTGEGEER